MPSRTPCELRTQNRSAMGKTSGLDRGIWLGATNLRITKVTPWLVKAPRPFLETANDNKNARRLKEYVFVEVSTDEGVTGWGEVTGTSAVSNRTVCAGPRHVSDLIAGYDPRLIEMIWNKVFRSFTYMGSTGRIHMHNQRNRYCALGHSRQGVGAADLGVVRRPGARGRPDLLPPTERIIDRKHRPARQSYRGHRP